MSCHHWSSSPPYVYQWLVADQLRHSTQCTSICFANNCAKATCASRLWFYTRIHQFKNQRTTTSWYQLMWFEGRVRHLCNLVVQRVTKHCQLAHFTRNVSWTIESKQQHSTVSLERAWKAGLDLSMGITAYYPSEVRIAPNRVAFQWSGNGQDRLNRRTEPWTFR